MAETVDRWRRQGGPGDPRRPAPAGEGRTLFHLALIALLVLAAYANTLRAPFVFDDEPSIVNNASIRDLAEFIKTGAARYPGRFIGYLTFALNYRLGRLDVTGYHVFNTAVHLINAVLLYSLILLTFRTPLVRASPFACRARGVAFFAALLFAVHPVQTQAVTYVVQRLTSLAALFMLASLVLYASFRLEVLRERPRPARAITLYLLSLAAVVLAMKTKEIAFVLPVVIAVYEFFFFPGSVRKRLPALGPILLTTAIIPLSLLHSPQSISEALSNAEKATRLQTELSRGDYLMTQFVVITKYTGLLVLPVNQNLDYDQPVFRSLLAPAVLGSLLFLAVLFSAGVCCLVSSRRSGGEGRPGFRLLSFGLFWFFIALSVESGVIPIADVMVEHRLYMPSAGFLLAASVAAFLLRDRFAAKGRRIAAAVPPVLFGAAVLLSGAAFLRNATWSDEVRLWEDTVRKSPEKARPRYNLGVQYEKRGRLDEAAACYRAALKLDPLFPPPYNNLGILYGKTGRIPEAMDLLQAVFRLEPGDATAHTNLGVLYSRQGKSPEAIREFGTAIRLDPDDGEAHFNLGIVYEQLGRPEEAAGEYAAAIRARPDYVAAYNNLGILQAKQNELEQAIATLASALKIDPTDTSVLRNLENAYRLRNSRRP